jgi:hypothetical protein
MQYGGNRLTIIGFHQYPIDRDLKRFSALDVRDS